MLGALAARGRYALEVQGATAAPARGVEVRSEDEPAAPSPRWTADCLAEARRQGWVAEAGSSGRFGLTSAGRQALRRSRCQISDLRARAPAQAGRTPAAPTTNPAESPLSWLASRKDAAGRPMLSATQSAAGERLRADMSFAQLTPRVTMGWSGMPISGARGAAAAGFGQDLADNVIAARNRVAAAVKAVGPGLSDILIDVCGHLRGLEDIARSEGWPPRAARLLLQRALAALARHYGLEPEVRVEETIARRLRHWGADDYRPTLASRMGDAQGE